MKSIKEQLENIRPSLKPTNTLITSKDDRTAKTKTSEERIYKICPECNCKLREGRYKSHLLKVHGKKDTYAPPVNKTKKAEDENEIVKCPQCETKVKKKNLKRHIKKTHDKKYKRAKLARKKTFTEPKFPKANKPSAEDAKQLLKTLNEGEMSSDKAIAEYVSKNPSKNEMGKFGVPQDKYRWGFYGSGSMEYDSWSKSKDSK